MIYTGFCNVIYWFKIGIRDVVILEALDRIGGRIHTIPVNGDWAELGAQWIHGRGENPLWKFVQENKVINFFVI